MNRKESLAKRKFSFDIPKLKIGPRTDSKSAHSTPKVDHDSPPTTPKSVRPPLSPKTDHQLRLACAYVLQDFKPSHQLYEERYGKNEEDKPRLSYPVVTKPDELFKDDTTQVPVARKISNRVRPERRKEEQQATALDVPKMKPTIKSQAFFEGLHIDSKAVDAPPLPDMTNIDQLVDEEIRVDLSSFNPPLASPAFFAGVDLDRLRKEQAATVQPPDPPKSPVVAESSRPRQLTRSVSNPISAKVVSIEHPRKWPRSESADTTASSPRTDGTENAWSSSTAPTSTAATPARGSMRQSSQYASAEKFLTSDIEWMRLELEKHKRLQDEARARLELENQVLASLGMEPASSLVEQSPPVSTQMPIRKPVSGSSDGSEGLSRGRSTNQSIQERRKVPPVPELDSAQREQLARSESKKQRTTPRSESAHELDMLRPESRESRKSRRASETSEPGLRRSLSREIRDYFTSNSTDAAASASNDMSRASSRSRRMFQLNIRPSDGTRAPLASIESSKPQSRSRSIDSVRSAVSAVAPSLDSAASKLRSWKSSRNQDSILTHDTSRTGSSLSKRHSRDFSREFQDSPNGHRKGKSSVNLNRELPPLPSLDQWKPLEAEKPKHIISMASPKRGSFRMSDVASASEPNLLDSAATLTAEHGSYTASTSRIQSIYSRYSKLSDGWRPEQIPPYSAVASPGLPPETVPEGYSAVASPALPPETIPQSIDETMDESVEQTVSPVSPVSPLEAEPDVSLPASPPYLAVETKQQHRVPSEYMFRSNLGAVTVPMTPPPIPVPAEPETQLPKTIKRRTENMFLPDLDARARSETHPERVSSKGQATVGKAHVVNYSRSVKRQNTAPIVKRQNTAPMLLETATTNTAAAASHNKSQSEQINLGRKEGSGSYSRLYDMGYRNIVQIKPQATAEDLNPHLSSLPQRKESKRWWKRGTSKKEKSSPWTEGGVKTSSLLSVDETAPTLVRF